MIDALISGKLIKTPEQKTGKSGKPYCQFLLGVHADGENVVVSCIAFGDQAERVGKLGKGDALSVAGALKLTEWVDRNTNETKHGLNVTVSSVLSVYDVRKKRKTEANTTQQDGPGYAPKPFDDELVF